MTKSDKEKSNEKFFVKFIFISLWDGTCGQILKLLP